MTLFGKREKEVRQKIDEYFKAVDEAMAAFDQAMRIYLEKGAGEEFRAHDKLTHKAESRADDLRWDIEVSLYSRAILPESRDDLLSLLENFDHVPNLAENITFQFDTQRIVMPEVMKERLGKLIAVNLEAYRLVRLAVDHLFSDPSQVDAEVKAVDQKESESDWIERELIIEIFGMDLPGSVPLQLREVVTRIGDISDTAEKLARRIEIIALKKRI
jgi:predicted phosphate transport protein (TIGR00153 family)